ncbi:glycosyltransferase [Shewanella sp. 6_MG-2023]|uniref:glycosyltransferase n=1 Tax=Shewanella sp. 6_MG-2023 TaxID=3062660 RepID=UPI0026E29168|nr:glycosyltransferase [Shewanella sp. 6_MG-2023]MDO6617613.1 glycosyltransferase [Shewanella sp. 6_MG-2023]
MKTKIKSISGGKRNSDDEITVPFFSIITVTYNNITTLPRCLEAILCQSFQDFEVVIVDGGSNDGTKEFLLDRKADIDCFVSEPDAGIYNAINKGIRLAKGEVIGLIHSDDILSFNALERYHQTFEQSDADMVLGDCCYVDENLRFTNYKPARNYGLETIFRGITGAHEAVFIKKKAYKQIGLYDETYRSAADFKLLSAMVSSGLKTAMTKRLEVYKLIGGESFSKEVEFNENFRLAKEYIPELTAEDYEHLLKLKNYRDRSKSDLHEIYNIISRIEANSTVLRSLSLSLLTILLGDDKNTSFNRTNEKLFFENQDYSDNRVLFGAIAIKGVTGGAERVLIDVASSQSISGKEVLITSADGKAGTPYYKPNGPIDMVDVFEPPFNKQLMVNYDLQGELTDVINKLPEDILFVVHNCLSLRHEFRDWSQFVQLCKNENRESIETIRNTLHGEVNIWVKKHGGRVSRWRTLINKYKPGVVVPFMISATTQMFIAARKTRAKVIISNHGNPIRDYLYQDDWDNSMLDRALRLFSTMASYKSHWLDEKFLEFIPHQSRKKSVPIPNPVTGSAIVPPFKDREKVILGVGRLIPLKRFEVLIKAFSQVKNKNGWVLNIYGEGPDKQRLQTLITELNIESEVYLKGRTTQIFDRYAESGMLVSCSEMEGFGLTVAEALASGVPAIVPESTSGLNELVTHRHNGLLVSDNSEQELLTSLTNAISELIVNQSLREKLSLNTVESMAKYSEEKIFKTWSLLLNEIN